MNELINYFGQEQSVRIIPVKKGQNIFKAEEAAAHLFLLLSGVASLHRPFVEDKDETTILYLAGPGSFLGFEAFQAASELPNTDRMDEYHNSAEAITDSRLLKIPKAEVLKLREDRPDLALKIADQALSRMMFVEQLKGMERFTAYRRLAIRVLEFAQIIGNETESGIELAGLDQRTWGQAIGTRREIVNRSIPTFRDYGILDQVRRNVVLILDAERLDQVARGLLTLPQKSSPSPR